MKRIDSIKMHGTTAGGEQSTSLKFQLTHEFHALHKHTQYITFTWH